jgi:type VI secretion system protein ImpA
MSAEPQAIVEPLLAPLAGEDPCGPPLRHDPVFTEIRLAREEDDPSLPMRQWERPLKKADWALIEQRCTTFLKARSKDLQIAAWLLESWTRQRGWAGLEAGLALLRSLIEKHWEGVHPRIDADGDADARVAPFQWINEALPVTLKAHVPIATVPDRKPSRITFADWERLTLAELAGTEEEEAEDNGQLPPPTRAEVLAAAIADTTGRHPLQLQQVRACIAHLAALDRALDERLGTDAPNLHKVLGALESIERVLQQFQPVAPAAPPEAAEAPAAAATAAAESPNQQGPAVPAPIPFIPANTAPISIEGVNSRDEAYRALEALAEYLGRIEPHSPAPYLIRRAVSWGRMPLPELMQEIIREEGDLNRMAKLLGLGHIE